METGVAKIPKLADLVLDPVEAFKNDQFNLLMYQPVPKSWIKEHPNIPGWKYLPIDKVELMLRRIFKEVKIEVMKTGMLMNAVEATVRVHYKHPVSGEWQYHDGVGACELQTQKGTGALKADMSNVNRGAVSMALPIAKSLALKDACDHFGTLFGANLNRKDVLDYTPDENLKNGPPVEIPDEIKLLISEAQKDNLTVIYRDFTQYHSNPEFMQLLNKRKEQLNEQAV